MLPASTDFFRAQHATAPNPFATGAIPAVVRVCCDCFSEQKSLKTLIKPAPLAIFFVALAIQISQTAHAACTVPPANQALEQQLKVLPDCQRNADYLAQIGHLLNSQGRYLDALDHLERALMFEPNLAPAQFDYAIALAGTGDILSARLLLDKLLAEPDLPPQLRQTLVQAKQRFARYSNPARSNLTGNATLGNSNAGGGNGNLNVTGNGVGNGDNNNASSSQFSVNLSANLRTGRDNNLLGAPNVSSLELTFPGEVVVLQLSGSNAPRAGNYTRSDAKLELTHQNLSGSRWEVAASVMQRTSPSVPEANTRQSELVVEYSQPPLNNWGGYVSASFVNLNTEGGTHYASQGAAFGLQLSPWAAALRGACSARVGAEWQTRDLASNSVLSGRYTGVTALWACSSDRGGQWQVSGKAGLDRPQSSSRPGGEQAVSSIRTAAIWPASNLVSLQYTDGSPVSPLGTVLLDAELSQSRDATGYSALLGNGAVRHTTRLTARVEYQRPLSNSVLATFGTEWSGQDANLPLFKVKSWGPYAALRVLW